MSGSHDTQSFSFQLLLPLLPPYHIKEMNISSIHVTDLNSSPESLSLIVRRSRAVDYDGDGESSNRDRDRNDGSFTVDSVSCWLIVITMADPVSCWHLTVLVDHDWGGSWWWLLMAAVDNDCGLWWHPIVMVDHVRGGCWPWNMMTTILFDIQYFYSDTLPLLTIIHQSIDLQLCHKVFILINAANTPIFPMFSITYVIYCTSVRPGRGIPHMRLSLRFLRSFYPVKVFLWFSLLLFRVKGRGCHTLLKPYETWNCDLSIWAIQIKFDWLIDFRQTS